MALNLSTLKTPGVYIDEIPTLPSSVVGVETAIPAFIGYVEKMIVKGKDIFADPTVKTKYARITSMKEYTDIFGGPKNDEVTYAVDIKDQGTGAPGGLFIVESSKITVTGGAAPKFLMFYQLQMYFANGGGPCYIVPAGDYSAAATKKSLQDTLENVVASLDEPTLIVFPDAVSLATENDIFKLYEAALLQCTTLMDRFTLIDLPQDDDKAERFRAGINSTASWLRFGAAYQPWLKTGIAVSIDESGIVITHKQQATGNPPPALIPGPYDTKKLSEIKQTAFYAEIKKEIDANMLILPPSAALAGIYAFNDNNRGVWKAPANVGVANVNGLTKNYTDEEQKNMNVDPDSGKSINIIRNFTGRGIVVWGARTLEGNSNEWRYIATRRFFNFVEESVKKALNAYVFEPNDANTWVKVQATIENFLKIQWQAGALQGSKPEQAYFVRVGLGVTMSQDDILNGRLIIAVGMAVVRPAEFIILRFMHKLAES